MLIWLIHACKLVSYLENMILKEMKVKLESVKTVYILMVTVFLSYIFVCFYNE